MSNQTGKNPRLLILDCSLRLCLIPLSVASLWLTVTNNQNNFDYGNIKFSNFMGLKYMACTAALAAGYALVALICTWVRCFVNKSWVFFLSDQVMAYLLVTSGSAVMEILYLAYKGDIEVTWSEACNTYGSFCHRIYDSDPHVVKDSNLPELVESITHMVPLLMKYHSALAKKYKPKIPKPFVMLRSKETPKIPQSGNCGVYTICFVQATS